MEEKHRAQSTGLRDGLLKKLRAQSTGLRDGLLKKLRAKGTGLRDGLLKKLRAKGTGFRGKLHRHDYLIHNKLFLKFVICLLRIKSLALKRFLSSGIMIFRRS
jgi:hypothetical protein